MSTIYIAEPGGEQTGYSEERAWKLWGQDSISRKAVYWREGMADWRPITELYENEVKDATTLTRFLKLMLWLSMGVAVLGVLADAASLAGGSGGKSDSEGLRLLGAISGVLTLLAFIATSVPFLMWVHRANRNARALGAHGMRFSPGWSVGWYFVPLLSLWKPYQVMKELWQASHNPHSWAAQDMAPSVGRWWGLWLLSNFLGQMTLRFSLRTESSPAFVSSTVFGLLTDAVNVALCLAAVRLVSAIYRKQGEWMQKLAAPKAQAFEWA
jgi:hypothetical protein